MRAPGHKTHFWQRMGMRPTSGLWPSWQGPSGGNGVWKSSLLLCNKPEICDPSRTPTVVPPPGTGVRRCETKQPVPRDRASVPAVPQSLSLQHCSHTRRETALFTYVSSAGFCHWWKITKAKTLPPTVFLTPSTVTFPLLSSPNIFHQIFHQKCFHNFPSLQRCVRITEEYSQLSTTAQHYPRSTKVYMNKWMTEPPNNVWHQRDR